MNQQIPISFVEGYQIVGRRELMSFDELAGMLCLPSIGEKEGLAWLGVDIEPGPRKAERVKSVSVLYLDIEQRTRKETLDDGSKREIPIGPIPQPPEVVADVLGRLGLRALVHTTFHHTAERPRYRIVVQISHSLATVQFREITHGLIHLLGLEATYDRSCVDVARLMFLPRVDGLASLAQFRSFDLMGQPYEPPATAPPEGKIGMQGNGAHGPAVTRRLAGIEYRPGSGDDIIDAFNDLADIPTMLEHKGYAAHGPGRWLYPLSTTGKPGVYMLSHAPQRIISEHANDPLFTESGQGHDAFSVLTVLFHDGDAQAAYEHARQIVQDERDGDGGSSAAAEPPDWPEPEPLVNLAEAYAFPSEALAPVLSAALADINEAVEAPAAMITVALLCAVSVAAQAHFDVQRSRSLRGPVSLYSLLLAKSGERKTSVDRLAMRAVRSYELAEAKRMVPQLADHRASIKIFEAKMAGLKERLKKGEKAPPATGRTPEKELRDLEANEPGPLRWPQIESTDATSEALAWHLMHNWPSGALIASEAALVLGGHAMYSENQMRNLGLLNILWEDGSMNIRRRSGDTYTLQGARLTVSLAAQPGAMAAFLDKSDLARDLGWLARFLFAHLDEPHSTMGTRFKDYDIETMPGLDTFDQKITTLLERRPILADNGALVPMAIRLSRDARQAWKQFADAVERELAPFGRLADLSDFAAKTADNAVRIAALLQIIESPNPLEPGAVSLSAMETAIALSKWWQNEAMRYFGAGTSHDRRQLLALDQHLIAWCRHFRTLRVPMVKLYTFQGVPDDKKGLMKVLDELMQLGRIRIAKEPPARAGGGRPKQFVEVNPVLLV